MSEYTELRESDLINPNALYRAYKDYTYLYNFLRRNREEYAVSKQEMRDRIDYILKNKVKQRDEIATLCWILGEEDARNNL